MRINHFFGLDLLVDLGILDPASICWVQERNGIVHIPSCEWLKAWEARAIAFKYATENETAICWACSDKYLPHNIDENTFKQAQSIGIVAVAIKRLNHSFNGTPLAYAVDLGQTIREWVTGDGYLDSHPTLTEMHIQQFDQLQKLQDKYRNNLEQVRNEKEKLAAATQTEYFNLRYFNDLLPVEDIDAIRTQKLWLHFAADDFIPDAVLGFSALTNLERNGVLAETTLDLAAIYGVSAENMLALGDDMSLEDLQSILKLTRNHPGLGVLEKAQMSRALQASHI